MRSLYGLPYGILKVENLNLLNLQDYKNLMKVEDISDILSMLGERGFKDDITQYANQYSGLDLIEISNNSHLSRMNRVALNITPYNGKDLVASYLSKWDILNLKTIIAAKASGIKVDQTQIYIVTSKNEPVGIYAGLMSYEDYKNILSLESIEEIMNYTLKFGYGKTILSLIDDYRKNNNLSTLLLSLDLYYYDLMREKFRFYNGSEGPIYRFIRKNIDAKNVMTIMKGIEYGDPEQVKDFIIKGGLFSDQQIDDLIKSSTIEEVVSKIKGSFNLSTGVDYYKKTSSLVVMEAEIERSIHWEFLEIFEMSSLSLNNVMGFLMRVEAQWKDIRRIASAKNYKIPDDQIGLMLINKVM